MNLKEIQKLTTKHKNEIDKTIYKFLRFVNDKVGFEEYRKLIYDDKIEIDSDALYAFILCDAEYIEDTAWEVFNDEVEAQNEQEKPTK
jgi:hypothetical protein